MNFDVPQYIDVEDKIAFQLTAKQLGWFGLGGILMFLAWNFAAREVFIMWSIVIILICLAFAFLKPHGITLAAFIGYGFMHLIRPKQYIWQREIDMNSMDLKNQIDIAQDKKDPKADAVDKAAELARILDSKRSIRY